MDICLKEKKDETFDELVHRINLKTPVSINKILGLEEGTLLRIRSIYPDSRVSRQYTRSQLI